MSEQVETETVETEETVTEATGAEETGAQETEVEDPVAGLKSALQKERALNKANAKRIKELEQAAADRDKSPDEKALDDARREAAAEATQAANIRVVRSEFRALAKERGLDPNTATKLADLSTVEVDDDGNVDGDALTAAIDAVIADHPSLVPSRFEGTADQGNHVASGAPKQITSADQLKNMSAEEVNKARREGRLNKLLGIS